MVKTNKTQYTSEFWSEFTEERADQPYLPTRPINGYLACWVLLMRFWSNSVIMPLMNETTEEKKQTILKFTLWRTCNLAASCGSPVTNSNLHGCKPCGTSLGPHIQWLIEMCFNVLNHLRGKKNSLQSPSSPPKRNGSLRGKNRERVFKKYVSLVQRSSTPTKSECIPGLPLRYHLTYTHQQCPFGKNRGAGLVSIIIYLLKGFPNKPLF